MTVRELVIINEYSRNPTWSGTDLTWRRSDVVVWYSPERVNVCPQVVGLGVLRCVVGSVANTLCPSLLVEISVRRETRRTNVHISIRPTGPSPRKTVPHSSSVESVTKVS